MFSSITSWLNSFLKKWKESKAVFWTKEILAILFFLAIIVWVGSMIFSGCNKSTTTSYIPSLQDVKSTRDSDGDLHSEINTLQIDRDDLKQLVDSLNVQLKKKVKVQALTQYVYMMDTVIKRVPVYIDTTGAYHFTHEDSYIAVEGNGNINTGSVDLSLSSIDTLVYVQRRIKHLLKPDEYNVEIINKSPYNRITKGRSFVIKERKPILTLGAGVSVNPINKQVTPAIGVYIPIFSIKTK